MPLGMIERDCYDSTGLFRAATDSSQRRNKASIRSCTEHCHRILYTALNKGEIQLVLLQSNYGLRVHFLQR